MKRFSLCSARERITASILCAVLTVCMGILIYILRFDLLSLLICAVACIAVGAGLVFYVLNLYRCGITVRKGASTLLVHGFPEYTVDLKEAVSLQTAAFKNGPVATRTLVFFDEAGNIVASIPTFFTANQGAYAEPMARELADSLGLAFCATVPVWEYDKDARREHQKQLEAEQKQRRRETIQRIKTRLFRIPSASAPKTTEESVIEKEEIYVSDGINYDALDDER